MTSDPLEGMDLREAKEAVHLGSTWSDRYEIDEALHDRVEQALEQIDRESR